MTASSRAKRVNLRNVISRPAKLGALELNKQETCSCTTIGAIVLSDRTPTSIAVESENLSVQMLTTIS